ncbi:DNA primase [Bombilactobacillus folatiphilus]|uniref:DNA primase n=1 Tax=Bombilactobacillus folatiphilus TaxID=2923362 RepID=A0ABY4P7K5_9LACO|nr:DNA primase [Bombilactobacillus folatiphilus]UQS81516.1 DNA primase [Bombilactobacillus folatiphilus]
MAKIPSDVIENVRQKTNIVDIIEPYVQLKKSGQNLFGLCPFHEERTPSFSVSEEKQIFHCFSCGRGGNAFKFLMEMESMTFPEAVLKVAELSGVSLPAQYSHDSHAVDNSPLTALKQDYQTVRDFYHYILCKTAAGEQALNYLHQRQLSDETIDHFQIGYAPAANNTLVDLFQSREKNLQELVDSGLFAQSGQGKLFDRFRDRVMFPINDQSGSPIAFSGRILQMPAQSDQPVAKYLNSPETKIFNKSQTLFNLDEAKRSIRQLGEVILFEGFMDVISAYQAGIENGVASMGTSLTDQQLYTLNRLTKRIVICYDGDDPGIKAALRAMKLLRETDFEVGIVIIPSKQDPDEFIKSQGAQAFQTLVQKKSLTPTAFMIEYLSQQYDLTNDGAKVDFLNTALEYVVVDKSPVERELYIKQLAQRLNVSVRSIQQEVADKEREQVILQPAADYGVSQSQEQSQLEAQTSTLQINKTEQSERNLLNIVFQNPDVISVLDQWPNFSFVHEQYQDLFDYWVRYCLMNAQPLIADFMDEIPDRLRSLASTIEMMSRPRDYSDEEINDYINNIMYDYKQQQLQQYQAQVKQAAQIGDVQQELDLTVQLVQLRQELEQLQ